MRNSGEGAGDQQTAFMLPDKLHCRGKEDEDTVILGNYHTHTTFCDGKNSAEEMVQQAIRLGLRELGFSGHSFTFFDQRYCMTQAGTQAYKETVRMLQEKYRDQIKIYLGVEQDYYSGEPTDDYDYVIGSVHYIKKDGHYLPVDHRRESQLDSVQRFYHGDFYRFIEDYYDTVADVYRKTRCNIVGHFDLIAKFNAKHDLFDPQHPRYVAAVNKALQALMSAPVILEVSVGGIVKGYMNEPYPAKEILSQWLAAGKPIQYASDCHLADKLLFGRDIFEEHVKACR